MTTNRFGTAEWADPEAVKKYLFEDGKFWLGRTLDNDALPLGYQDDRHICLVSGSRGGKGTSIIINNLCLYPGSVVVIDPKGENASVTAARRGPGSEYCGGMGQAVYVLDPFNKAQVSDSIRKRFNPLDVLDANREETLDEAGRIANAVVVINRESKEPVWDEQARDLIEGLILHIVTTNDFAERRSLVTVRDLIMRGDWEAVEMLKQLGTDNINSSHALLFARMQNNPAFGGVIQGCGVMFGNMLADAPRQFQGVLQAASTHTKFIDSPGMRRCLSASDFALSDLKTKPEGVSLYLSLPQGYMDTHYRWLRMMISLTTTEMEKVKGKPATGHPVLIVLDEFAGLDRMKVLEKATAQIAGFGVKLFFILQSVGQLKEIYKDNWEIFLECAGLKIFFNIDGYGTQEYISKLVGDTEVLIESQSENIGEVKGQTRNDSGGLSYKRKFLFFRGDKRYDDRGSQTTSTSTNQTHGTTKTPHKRELIKTNEVGKRFASIKDKYDSKYPGLGLVLTSGENPFVVRRVNYHEDGLFVGKFDPHPDHDSKIERLRDVEVPVDGFAESGWCFVSCIEWIVPEGQQVKKNEPLARFVDSPGQRFKGGDLLILAPESGVLQKHLYKTDQRVRFSGGIPRIGMMQSNIQTIASEWHIPYQQPAYDVLRDHLERLEKRAAFIVPVFGCLPLLAWEAICLVGTVFGYSNFGALYGTLGLIAGLILGLLGFFAFLAFSLEFNIPCEMEHLEGDISHHKHRSAEGSRKFYPKYY